MSLQTKSYTAEELLDMESKSNRFELVRGEIIEMSPAGFEHGRIAGNIFFFLAQFVRQRDLGVVCAAETGFVLTRNPDTVRAPDAAFVAGTRELEQPTVGFFEGPPDLAVEVISPSESYEDVESKIFDYLSAGTTLIWIINPRTRTLTVYAGLDNVKVLTADDQLTGGNVLPGFGIAVGQIFD